MLLTLTTLEYYGPDAVSLPAVQGEGSTVFGSPNQSKRAGLSSGGAGTVVLFRPYRGSDAGLTGFGAGALTLTGHRRVRAGLTVAVNALSQDDVTGAVLESVIEDGVTLRQSMRLLLAYVAGDATGLETSPAFKSLDGSKTRLDGTISAGVRTVTTRDAT